MVLCCHFFHNYSLFYRDSPRGAGEESCTPTISSSSNSSYDDDDDESDEDYIYEDNDSTEFHPELQLLKHKSPMHSSSYNSI